MTGNLVGILPGWTDEAMRRISSHMPAAYQLLPFQKPHNEHPYLAVRTGTIFNRQITYIRDNTHEFMQNLCDFDMINIFGQSVPTSVRQPFFQRATNFMNGLFLQDGRHVIQTVNYYVIAGTGRQTIRTTILNESGRHVDTLQFYDGDGTVPFWSASIGGRVNPTVFPYAHLDLIFEQNVIDHVIGVLNHNVPPGTGVIPSHSGSIVIRIASPVETTIRLGDEVLSSKEAYFNRVASFGSLHFIGSDGSVELFALNADKVYDVHVVGTGYGTMTYSISFYDTKGNFVEERIFIDVPITYDTIITSNTNQEEATTLNVDTDGDGEYDITLYPTIISCLDCFSYPCECFEPTMHRITFMRNGGALNGAARDIAVHDVPSGVPFHEMPVAIPVAIREGFRFVHWRVDFAGENRTHLYLTNAELANFSIAHGHLHAPPYNSNLIIRPMWEYGPCECLEPTLHRVTFMRNGGTLNDAARDIAVHDVPSCVPFREVPVAIPVAIREGFRFVHWRVDFAGENRTNMYLTSAELANFSIAHGHLHALPDNSSLVIRAIWEPLPDGVLHRFDLY